MKHKPIWIGFLILVISASCARTDKGPAIYLSKSASTFESIGAAELRRYLYLLTGRTRPARQPPDDQGSGFWHIVDE